MRKRGLSPVVLLQIVIVPRLIPLLLLAALLELAVQTRPSTAAEPDIWNIPPPTIVFQMEKAPRCKGCPSFDFTIYSDKTYHWEGREAVFFLGEGGDYRRWEAFRLADQATERRPGAARAMRQRYLKGVEGPLLPVHWVSDFMNAVATSGFFELPSGDMSALSDADTRGWTRFEANWMGRHRVVNLQDRSIPSRLQHALSMLFVLTGTSEPMPPFWVDSEKRSAQPTPPFWADDDAVLWLSEAAGHRRCDNTGLILYKSGKAVMFGWMHRARNKAFQTISDQLDQSVLQEIFAGFDQGKVDPERSVDPERPGRYQSFHADLALIGGGTRHVVIYKPKPNLLAEIPAISWAKLREVRDKMKAKMLGPDDPPYAELCRPRRPS